MPRYLVERIFPDGLAIPTNAAGAKPRQQSTGGLGLYDEVGPDASGPTPAISGAGSPLRASSVAR